MIDYLESLGMELDQIEELMDIYDSSVIHSIDLDNMKKIVNLMKESGFSIEEIRDILSIDFELFTYDFSFIKEKMESLKRKYQNNYLDRIIESPELLYGE